MDMDTETMQTVKKILSRVNEKDVKDAKKYKEICGLVDSYIFSNCHHDFETDLFDIDPDRSVVVKYCIKCFYHE
jgi:hypothetical protein